MVHSDENETRRDRLVFYPIAAVGGFFCFTVFVFVAATFGDPAHPIQGWINRHGTTLLLTEAAVLVGVGLAAMTIDRRSTLRRRREQGVGPPSVADSADPAAAREVEHVD